jgi:RsiW-degrading membrane proteinase PrsW (M82 family)
VKRISREVLWLVIAVLLVDAVFIGAYFVARVRGASGVSKLIFTALWTLVTLAVVIRGLARVRSVRLRQSP